MSFVSLQVNYLYFQGGPGHVRHPRSNPPTSGLVEIPGLGSTQGVQTGVGLTPEQVKSFGASLPVGANTVNYVMLSISGAQSGNKTWLVPQGYATLDSGSILKLIQDQILPVIPGTTAMTIDFIYGPLLGAGGVAVGPPGASIDAFFEGNSALVDNVFVTVSPDNGATAIANNDGWVDTSAATETITADEYITPDGADPNEVSAAFYKWVDMLSPWQSAEFNRAVFTASQGQSYWALALYKVDPCQGLRSELANFNLGDFPNPAAGEKALTALRNALFQCERLNGEFPIPEV